MTDIVTITDTGKRRTSSSVAEEADIANSGAAMTLHGVELVVDDQAMLNTNPPISKYTTDATSMWSFGEVDTIGCQKPKWTARGMLDINSSADMALVKALRMLPRTKGYKVLSGDLADWSDGLDNGSTVNVHVASVKISHTSNSNLLEYSIEMYQTE